MSQRENHPLPEKLLDFLRLGEDYLHKNGIESSRLEAEQLLCSILDLTRMELYLNFDRPISADEMSRFREFLRRRADHEPLQYITGKTGFYSLTLSVLPGVLIPRPETELIVELTKKYQPDGGFETAIDLGCGSGAIALSLLVENISKSVYAIDVSPEALRCTTKNATNTLMKQYKYSKRMKFEAKTTTGNSEKTVPCNRQNNIEANTATQLWETVRETEELFFQKTDTSIDIIAPSKEKILFSIVNADVFSKDFSLPVFPVDCIVSNPPYVAVAEFDGLPSDVRNHEPELALVSGEDGLSAHRAIASSLDKWLQSDGVFLGEIGETQGEAAVQLYHQHGFKVLLHKDLNQRDRVIEARKK